MLKANPIDFRICGGGGELCLGWPNSNLTLSSVAAVPAMYCQRCIGGVRSSWYQDSKRDEKASNMFWAGFGPPWAFFRFTAVWYHGVICLHRCC